MIKTAIAAGGAVIIDDRMTERDRRCFPELEPAIPAFPYGHRERRVVGGKNRQ
jgi:hypothetical protein